MAAALDVPPLVAQVLWNRGIRDAAAAQAVLSPALTDLHDPWLLPDIVPAIDRIITALRRRERIAIYGDYDVDGTVGTSLWLLFLRAIGQSADWYIPDRNREGYGVHRAAVEQFADTGITLLITVDTGTSSHEAMATAVARGIDVIITDHHACPATLPSALAVVNPHRPDATYPYRELCGTGVTFKVLMALRAALRRHPDLLVAPEPNLKQWLDLVAVATIADIVPLTGENRILCAFGLEQLRVRPHAALAELMAVAGVTRDRLDARAVAFQLAPRINAAGRMAHARTVVEFLTTEDATQRRTHAAALQRWNTQRQAEEAEIQTTCEARIQAAGDMLTRSSLVLADAEFSPGIVGIVAGRLAEQYRLPTILIGLRDGLGRGSGRGVGDFPLLDTLAASAHCLEKWGGHQQAVGVTVATARLAEFEQAFEAAAAARLLPHHRERALWIDAVLTTPLHDQRVVAALGRLGPFGHGHREPLVLLQQQPVLQRRIVGERHLKLRVGSSQKPLDVIGFGMGNREMTDASAFDLVGTLDLNTYGGVTTVQMVLRALRPSENCGISWRPDGMTST